MNEKLTQRFEELIQQVAAVEATKQPRPSVTGRGTVERLDNSEFLNWKVKAKTLLERACGKDSEHFRQFEEQENLRYFTNVDILSHLKAVFLAAKEDFEGGHLVTMRSLVRAEVFDNELDQAEELLRNGYFPAAAIIAGVVLESNLKDLCDIRRVATGKLSRMNDDLVKAGAYNSLVHKQITSLAAVRNDAAHGNHSNFSKGDVEDMLRSVRRLITERFV